MSGLLASNLESRTYNLDGKRPLEDDKQELLENCDIYKINVVIANKRECQSGFT